MNRYFSFQHKLQYRKKTENFAIDENRSLKIYQKRLSRDIRDNKKKVLRNDFLFHVRLRLRIFKCFNFEQQQFL